MYIGTRRPGSINGKTSSTYQTAKRKEYSSLRQLALQPSLDFLNMLVTLTPLFAQAATAHLRGSTFSRGRAIPDPEYLDLGTPRLHDYGHVPPPSICSIQARGAKRTNVSRISRVELEHVKSCSSFCSPAWQQVVGHKHRLVFSSRTLVALSRSDLTVRIQLVSG